jgi:hypothetical protein
VNLTAQIFLLSGIADIKVVGDIGTAVEDGAAPTDDDEFNTLVHQPLNSLDEVHFRGGAELRNEPVGPRC